MKLGGLDLVGSEDERRLLVETFNATERAFPAEQTVGALFAAQAARTPDAEAVVDATGRRSYAELARDVDRLAGYLVARGVGPEVHVGALLRRSYSLVVALLATLRAGGVYVPLNPALPAPRLRALALDADVRVLVTQRELLATAGPLHWECPAATTLLCLDSDDVDAELEPAGPRMEAGLWDLVASGAGDAIEAGGWRSPHTGELLSAEAMAAFVDGAVRAVAPRLGPDADVLEIGCGSGLTLAGLAPLATRYVGTDFSAAALEWARRRCEQEGWAHVSLHRLDALELPDGGPFDAVVLNSVVQSLSGFNRLREVLRRAIARVRDGGFVYLGHVWDPDRRDALPPERQSDALFVPAAFFDDLRFEVPRLAAVELRPMGCDVPELSAYAYDVVLEVGPAGPAPPPVRRRDDRRALTDASVPVDRHAPGAAAYVIQTSGSTGRPRCVEIEMRALVNLLWWYCDACAIGPESRLAQVIPSSFDASVKNFLAPLVSGAALVLLDDGPFDPDALLALIEREAVTVLNPGVPSMIYPLAAGGDALRSLRCLALGGEAPDADRLREWPSAVRILNVYGPTECADIACWHEVTADELAAGGPLPVGRPVHNAQAYVLGPGLELEPVGVVGELCVSGAGLARGYLGDPEQTAARFVAHPFRPGERLYRTGDLAHRLENGELVLHGRADSQVKIRGHRIELGEVESELRRLPGVTDAAAALHDQRLVGYVLGETFDERAAREALRLRLPAAAVPDTILRLDRWPLSPHGKLDRRALPAPERAAAPGRPPGTALERTIAAAWRDVLRLDHDPSAEAGFFDAGGDSLGAALLVVALRDAGVELSTTDVYRAQTIAAQATLVGQRGESARDECGRGADDERGERGRRAGDERGERGPGERGELALHALGGDGPPLFAFPPIAGFAWALAELARSLDGIATSAFDFPGGPDPVQRCADAIGEEPCLLAGYSAGGLLAAATAVELARRGVAVDGLVLFDAAPPALRERYPSAATQALVDEVLADPRQAAHIALAGHDRVRQVVLEYAAWYDGAALTEPLACDVLVVTAEGADPAWAEGWRAVTTGSLTIVAGSGGHDDLLSGVHAARNAAVAGGWLRRQASRSSPLPE